MEFCDELELAELYAAPELIIPLTELEAFDMEQIAYIQHAKLQHIISVLEAQIGHPEYGELLAEFLIPILKLESNQNLVVIIDW
jgi:hypothetical protein